MAQGLPSESLRRAPAPGAFVRGSWLADFRPPPWGRLSECLASAQLLGLPVCPAEVISGRDAATLVRRAAPVVAALEVRTGRRLGDPEAPLLLTVQASEVGALLKGRRRVPHIASRHQLEEVLADAVAWSADPAAPTDVLVRESVGGGHRTITAVGLACTRDALTGEHGLYGECWPVGGDGALTISDMERALPGAYATLERALLLLEARHRVTCTLEFALTGEDLHITSGAIGVPVVPAAIRILVDLVDEGLVASEEALAHLPLEAMEVAERPVRAPDGALLSAQPDSYAARVLAWCCDHSAAAVVDRVPAGFVPARRPRDVRRRPAPAGYLVDLPPGSPPEAWSVLVAELAPRDSGLALVYDASLAALTPTLSLAPWTHVVAPPGRRWAAQVLAARLGTRDLRYPL